MTSKTAEFVVFVHLDGQCDAVPAGTLNMVEAEAEILQSTFGYGQRYVERTRALEMDPLTLALPGAGVDVLREPPNARGVALTEFGAFRDAAPDYWGRRVIENKLRRTGPLPESVYLQHGGTNRTGALDFRADPKSLGQPSPLSQLIDLQHLQEAAERIDKGEKIPAHLEMIFDAGATMGGARPKAVIEADDRQWLAKFGMPADKFAVPSVEFAALRMAKAAGLNAPDIRMEDFGAKKSAMLIERFDRHRVKAGVS